MVGYDKPVLSILNKPWCCQAGSNGLSIARGYHCNHFRLHQTLTCFLFNGLELYYWMAGQRNYQSVTAWHSELLIGCSFRLFCTFLEWITNIKIYFFITISRFWNIWCRIVLVSLVVFFFQNHFDWWYHHSFMFIRIIYVKRHNAT